jgi:hypothetical protein
MKQKQSFLNHIFYIFILLNSEVYSKYIDNLFLSSDELAQFMKETREEDLNLLNKQADITDVRSVHAKKAWTFIVYMAADNDLNYFAWKNLKQMELIGSNENITIVAQLNNPGSAPTKRYVIRKDKRVLVQDQTVNNQKLNSGSYHTLIDCVQWATTYYPAENYALILWNHGTGALDPHFGKSINPCELFYLNPTDNKLEIDRGISYLALICNEMQRHVKVNRRGICFDDSFKSYITNHDLELALYHITQNILMGKKLSLIGFDACLMSMIEVSSICKNYAECFVASQELEYGAGWKYDELLKPFVDRTLEPLEFAKHIVISYEKAYEKLINDYTLAALNLQFITELENNIDQVALILTNALIDQQNRTVSDILRKCKSTQYCTCFDEPSYIDLGHFYDNLLQHIAYITLKDKTLEAQVKSDLNLLLVEGKTILKNIVIENKVGSKLKKAQGISIYFPEYSINGNYIKSPFALKNSWLSLLMKYIKG